MSKNQWEKKYQSPSLGTLETLQVPKRKKDLEAQTGNKKQKKRKV